MTALERKVFKWSAVVGTAVTFGVVIADALGGLSGLEKLLYDRRARDCQIFRKAPSTQIVHIDIDDRALEAIGPWPWPRSQFAEFLSEINRASPKVIGIDIVYTDPAKPHLEEQPEGPPKKIDEDKAMADTLGQMGNVVIPVSLKLAPSKSVTALETAQRAELTANLELTPEQLASRLRVKGFKAEDVQPLMGDQFYAARREAMYDRILRETNAEKLSIAQLEELILPTTDKTLNSPIRRLLAEQFGRVNALRVVEKFALPLPKTGPRALATVPNSIPISTYAQAARDCGFADDNLTEAVVRSMPMFVECDGKLFPQWGLSFACVLADADLKRAEISAGNVMIPAKDGAINIPLRPQYSAAVSRSVPYIADIPWWGTSQWESMYDWPKYENFISHHSMNVVSDICLTQERISTNNAAIDEAVLDLLEAPSTNPPKLKLALDVNLAKSYRAHLPPVDEPDSRGEIIEKVDKIVDASALVAQFGAMDPDKLQGEMKAKYELLSDAARIMHVALDQNQQLAEQLTKQRADLASSIRGKGVLIGWTATGAVDMVTTPLHSRCPGVVVHGTITNALLTRQWWHTAPLFVTAVLTLGLGLLIAFCTSWLQPTFGVFTALVTAVIYFGINGIVLFDWGHWIVGAAGPLVAISLTWATCLVTRLIIEGVERIRKEKEVAIFRHEMELAKNVQVALIPKEMPTVEGIEPFGWTKPADETGGDLFDLWTLPDGRLGILVADASGHGLAPSVIVSQVRTLVRALSEIEKHPNGLLARVNARLAQDLEPARFVTCFLGFLNSEGQLDWASAGHGPMLWCAKEKEDFQSLDATALPLGIMPDFMGDEIGPLMLDIGGMLIVTSDGIFEAPNHTDEQFGIERVIETLKNHAGKSAVEIVAAIRDAVTGWQRDPDKPADDQTTVIIRRIATGMNVTIVEEKAAAVSLKE